MKAALGSKSGPYQLTRVRCRRSWVPPIPRQKEDVAKGVCICGGGADCKFKEGDRVRIEAPI